MAHFAKTNYDGVQMSESQYRLLQLELNIHTSGLILTT